MSARVTLLHLIERHPPEEVHHHDRHLTDAAEATVRRAQAGDEKAFADLYDQNAGRIYALCLRLAGDAVEATTLTQDVFVRAWTTLASFRRESAFGSWLHRLAVNVFLSQRRSAGRRVPRELQPGRLSGRPRPQLAAVRQRLRQALPAADRPLQLEDLATRA